jgi:hypothetical protein
MPEHKENYWSKHHTGVIQCVFALYCVVFSTYAYYHPRPTPPPESAGHVAAPIGAAVTMPSYSMPIYLWVGIIGLALSVAVPAILRFFRRAQTPSNPSIHEAAHQFAKDENYKAFVKAGIQAIALFTPLQRDTFQLAYELRQFLKLFGSRPVPERGGEVWLPDGTKEWMIARNKSRKSLGCQTGPQLCR